MAVAILLLFAIGYLAITLEHPLRLDKTVPALLMAAGMWALLALGFFDGSFHALGAGSQDQFGAQ